MQINTRSVLVVEDDEDIRESLRDILEEEGFRVVTAENGSAGLERLREMQRPCLILLDLFMPVMDGTQFLDELSRDHADVIASIPVVVVSAAPPHTEPAKGAARRAAAFVRKPVELEAFLKVVESYCCDLS